MLTFDQKLGVLSSFPELERKNVSLGRVNFHYEASAYDKKNVVYHLHPNGNGYVYAGMIPGAETDEKGFVNIRDWSESDLRTLVASSIASLSATPSADGKPSTKEVSSPKTKSQGEQVWTGPDAQTLRLTLEDDLWYVFSGPNLESAFETYEEATDYLREEGFSPSKN
jgi:hypothetical protein